MDDRYWCYSTSGQHFDVKSCMSALEVLEKEEKGKKRKERKKEKCK